MKIHLFGIFGLMLLLSGGCHKADAPEVKPKISATDSVTKPLPTPFAGTWKLYYSEPNLIAEIYNIPQDFQEVVGKDTSILRYDYFAQGIDSLIIYPNTWFNAFSASGNTQQSINGIIYVTNSMLIFNNYYWFMTNFTANELDLISPQFYVRGDCGMDDMLEQTVVKFKRVK